MRNLFTLLLTLLLLAGQFGATFWIARLINMTFLDTMFFTSIGFLALFIFFSSNGGLVSNYANVMASKQSFGNDVYKREVFAFRINLFVLSSLLFFIIHWILFIIHYI
ncbi:hypothetical protein [Alkalihalobacterium sp. APHAB7]|uniref:hypothetical protein n=1 Tax=Alkalihalobacterium sp. APHAB7 TaxID=3402081 RepID=UPI003AAB8E02